ncbi:outer membrane beta-barrel protein [Flavobacterium hungaricum]|uniref:outer membrane beta-barrel protein n=1 Tax=Flavobacterium hungaricum TaxID=2082725 RepID=UPI0018848B25
MRNRIKTLGFFVFLLHSAASFAQKNVVISGKIFTEKDAAIEAATIYLIHSKDSSVVSYTLSDKNGLFQLAVKEKFQNVILKISGEGYQEFSNAIEKLTQNMDLGVIKLLKSEIELKEVVIKREAPPIRIKNDTIEFNASSFKVRPDANVEALLKQLPGVTVDMDKKITVNGKEVNQVLVNGKPFFDADGKIALQNLPAELINKIQVSATKTKEQEFTKQTATSDNVSMNFTIDEEKNKGFFGKVLGGYGSADRYESSLLMSYFEDKKRISFLASSNNINSSGFTMDDVFDNMGGGRNDGARGASAGGGGITKSNMIGVNYADEWFKEGHTDLNYYFTNSNLDNTNRTSVLTLLPTGSLTAESNSKSHRDLNRHNANLSFDFKVSPSIRVFFTPNIDIGKGASADNFDKKTWDENRQLVNSNTSFNTSESNNTNFRNNITIMSNSKKEGRYFTASFQNDNSRNDSDTRVNSVTVFSQGTSPDDLRNQNVIQKNDRDKYTGTLQYTEPVSNLLTVNFSVITDFEKRADDKKTFDRNGQAVEYDVFNESLSNFSSFNSFQVNPKAGFTFRTKKFNATVATGTSVIKTENHAVYLKETTDLSKNYFIPNGSIYTSYKITKTQTLFMTYDYKFAIPTENQVLAVANLDNPLIVRTGNPDLKAATFHSLHGSFSSYNFQSGSTYNISFFSAYYDNQIVGASVYNSSGKQILTFDNVDGTYNILLRGEWNKTIKQEANTFRLSVNMSSNYNLDKGFTNGELYEAKTFRLNPTLAFAYDYGDLLSIRPSYNFAYNDTRYSNTFLSSTSNTTHNCNIEMTSFWPKNWVFGNDFGYTYNSNISGPYKKDFYLWNTSLSYRFAKEQFTVKVKVYDLLNQNLGTSRTITPTSVIDSESNVLKRYVMFSLLYKFQNFGTHY